MLCAHIHALFDGGDTVTHGPACSLTPVVGCVTESENTGVANRAVTGRASHFVGCFACGQLP